MTTVDEYRSLITDEELVSIRVRIKESDLLIRADRDLSRPARRALARYREDIEAYLDGYPGFKESLVPVSAGPEAPRIVREMARAGSLCGVGPMAAVAGALAYFVGRDLTALASEVIIENGGDIYLNCRRERTVAVYTGNDFSPFRRIGIRIDPGDMPLGVAASSGRLGRSLSWGNADAAVVVAADSIIADAAATRLSNRICRGERSIMETAGESIIAIPGVLGYLVICGALIAVGGRIELTDCILNTGDKE